MITMILASLLGDVIALAFGITLIYRKKGVEAFARYATPFAAGALLGAAFTDLLPDAVGEGSPNLAFLGTLAGILGFFLLERFVHWFHHHRDDNQADEDRDATVPLIVIGNILHRAIDGVAIAAGFLTSSRLGLVITVAIVIHEIPHTVGDFGLLIYKGLDKTRVTLINVAVALFTTLIAIAIYALGHEVSLPLGALIGITAGFFIYIAVSDIIPDIHVHEERRFIGAQSFLLIFGAVLVAFLMELLHHFFGNV
ncbi:MAG: ZIP family metal transporter [Streptococcaceae bacterium]|jgi:zinc and cadmium transporter|nr:ZIP family metal transporter [Streptococcaceae bacterium]